MEVIHREVANNKWMFCDYGLVTALPSLMMCFCKCS